MTICPNLTDDQVKMAFSKFDTSGDDKLDYREFCEMIKQKVGTEYIDKVDTSHSPLKCNSTSLINHPPPPFPGSNFQFSNELFYPCHDCEPLTLVAGSFILMH